LHPKKLLSPIYCQFLKKNLFGALDCVQSIEQFRLNRQISQSIDPQSMDSVNASKNWGEGFQKVQKTKLELSTH
jgi:hypothetical protein